MLGLYSLCYDMKSRSKDNSHMTRFSLDKGVFCTIVCSITVGALKKASIQKVVQILTDLLILLLVTTGVGDCNSVRFFRHITTKICSL